MRCEGCCALFSVLMKTINPGEGGGGGAPRCWVITSRAAPDYTHALPSPYRLQQKKLFSSNKIQTGPESSRIFLPLNSDSGVLFLVVSLLKSQVVGIYTTNMVMELYTLLYFTNCIDVRLLQKKTSISKILKMVVNCFYKENLCSSFTMLMLYSPTKGVKQKYPLCISV